MIFRSFTIGLCACALGFSSGAQAFVPPHFAAKQVSQPASYFHKTTLSAVRIQGAEDFVDGLASSAIGFLSDESLNADQKSAKFQKLLKSRFDMDVIGRFAMGRYWRTATSAQQKEYLSLFKVMVVDVYTRRFNEYQGQTLSVVSSRAEGKRDAMVSSVISQEAGPDVHVDWRVRYKDGSYKVIDVIVEGVSMALTQRSDFASVIQRGGGEVGVLLAHLRGGE